MYVSSFELLEYKVMLHQVYDFLVLGTFWDIPLS